MVGMVWRGFDSDRRLDVNFVFHSAPRPCDSVVYKFMNMMRLIDFTVGTMDVNGIHLHLSFHTFVHYK